MTDKVFLDFLQNPNDEKHQKIYLDHLLNITKDAIMIASMDSNFSLPEREKVYTFAGKLDISRNDVDFLEGCLKEYRALYEKWKGLVAGNY